MEIYTMNRGFQKQDEIDGFESAIWTDRYYGNGDFELVVPATEVMKAALPRGILMGCVESDQPMILETRDIKDGVLKTTGISLTQWLNNRIIRTINVHGLKEWVLPTTFKPGEAMAYIVSQMCMMSDYLDGTISIGIADYQTELFAVPGLAIGAIDTGGDSILFTVPFGQVYDALQALATTYEVGMKIVISSVTDSDYQIDFTSYRGADRTSDQTVNPVIQFSPDMDSLTDITDLESITDHKNYVYTFAPSVDPALITQAGFAQSPAEIGAPFPFPPGYGFDLRVSQVFIEVGQDLGHDDILSVLNREASNELINHKIVQLVDGQILETEDIKYGTNFFLGDIIERKGNTGIIQKARVTEYIHSKDSAGEKDYPTVEIVE